MVHGSYIAALLLAGTVSATAGQLATAPEPTAEDTIREIVTAAHHPDLKWPAFPYYKDEMQGLYEPRGYAPLWIADGKPIGPARDVLDALADSPRLGLDPTDYDAALLASRWRDLQSGKTLAPEELGRFDAGLTLAFLRQISDVHIGPMLPNVSVCTSFPEPSIARVMVPMPALT